MPAPERRYWIGIDGEGLGRKPHRYVLLAASDATGERVSHVENLRGLATDVCLKWFLTLPTDARIAGYYLGYDWTMILRDLPNRSIYRLLRPEMRARPPDEGGGFSPVRWRGFRLHFLSGMMRIAAGERSISVWDLGKFYQAPFVDSIAAWGVDAPHEMIADMKAVRGEFSARDYPRIRAYCFAECKALAVLATKLQVAHVDSGIKLLGWHGPGSTAGALLKRLDIGAKRGELPPEVEDVAARAYFGGRFEQSTIGRVPNAVGYDIVSAYPYQATRLPCLEHGVWRKVSHEREMKGAAQACVRYRLKDIGPEPWGPLPCRMSDGSIVFARSGARGWVWRDEWEAARDGWDGVEWGGEAWALFTRCKCQPFRELLDIFRERVRIGKTGRGRVLKLALNSVYGKLAQMIGRPPYASRAWAGMITSGTRAQLLRLVCAHRDRRNVYALATDGLYSGERLRLPRGPLAPDTLGAWEAEDHGPMVFVRPGIYWSEADGTVRARGVGRRTLEAQREAVLAAIDAGEERATLGASTLFGGARACVYLTPGGAIKRSEHYGEWHDVPARISLSAAPKRQDDWSLHRLPNVESVPFNAAPISADALLLRALGDIRWAMR